VTARPGALLAVAALAAAVPACAVAAIVLPGKVIPQTPAPAPLRSLPTPLAAGHGPTGVIDVLADAPLVGQDVRIVLAVPSAPAPSQLPLVLVSPSGAVFVAVLRRVAPRLWRTTYRFADDGAWTLRVRISGIRADAAVTVFQNGTLAPGPRPNATPQVGVAGNAGGGALVPGH